jgi:intracellular septation protein A
MDKKKVLRVLLYIIVFIFIATVIVYFIYKPANEWLAFYIACCGGILVVNLIISAIFVNKNFRDKDRA